MSSVMSVGFGNAPPAPPASAAANKKWFSDDEVVTLRVGGSRFETQVGTLRKYTDSKLAAMFPEDQPTLVPASNEFFVDRNPEAFSVILDLLRTDKLVIPPSMSEAKVQEELAYWNLGPMEDLDVVDTLEEDDTESDSPAKMFGVPSNVRLAVDASAANSSDQRLDTRYSMRADELFGRAIALVRQEDMVVKVSDIQHGLALLRELMSMERNNVSYMYYMAYGELRLGHTNEATYWIERLLRVDPANLAAISLRTIINDRRKQNSITGLVVLGGVAVLAAVWWLSRGGNTAPAPAE